MEDECAPSLRTNPAYLSRGSPTSRRHVGGRPDNFVLSPGVLPGHKDYLEYQYRRHSQGADTDFVGACTPALSFMDYELS